VTSKTGTIGQPIPGGAARAVPPRRGWSRFAAASPWWLMVIPALAFMGVLALYPVVQSVWYSFQNRKLGQPTTFAGLSNYRFFFSDPLARQAVEVTLKFAFAATALEIVLAWGLALLLWDLFSRIGTVVRVLFIIPMMLSPVVVGVMWRVMLQPGYGWIPYMLGNKNLDLLGQTSTALWTMVVVDAWQWTPFLFIIFAAALSSIPDDVIEAARVDGASYWRLITSIVWPMAMPITIVGTLFRLIDELKIFDLPYNLTQGGPGVSTQTFSIYTYQQAFVGFNTGYAATLAVIATLAAALVAAALLVAMHRAERRLS
jgi:multiple sugar transport system permease protein